MACEENFLAASFISYFVFTQNIQNGVFTLATYCSFKPGNFKETEENFTEKLLSL
jgi:hypothetical protein